VENQKIFAIRALETDGADTGLFAQLVFDTDSARVATNAFEAATELLSVPSLLEMMGATDGDEQQ
jgi:hypothetical protein